MAKSRQGQKQCPSCNAWVKGTRTQVCPKCDHEFNGKKKATPARKAPASKPEPAQVVIEKPTKVGDIVTIAQVRAVAEFVAVVGGFDRCHELLGIVREVGGLKRMKDLLDALAAAQISPSKV